MKKLVLIVVAAFMALIILASAVVILLPSGETKQKKERDTTEDETAKEWNGKATHVYNLTFKPDRDSTLEIQQAGFERLRGLNGEVTVVMLYQGPFPSWLTEKNLSRTFSFKVEGKNSYRPPRLEFRGPSSTENFSSWEVQAILPRVPTSFLDRSGRERLAFRVRGVMPRDRVITLGVQADPPAGSRIGEEAEEELAAIRAQKKAAQKKAQARKAKAQKKAKARKKARQRKRG